MTRSLVRRLPQLACGVLAVASLSAPIRASAQVAKSPGGFSRAEDASRVSGARLLRYSAIGALAGSVMALGYYAVSEKGQRGGECQPLQCALPYLTVSGAIAGLFMGRELEMARAATAPREGTVLRYASSAAAVLSAPITFELRDTLIVTASDSGVQLVAAMEPPRPLARRAAGLRAIRQVALLPNRSSIAIGTATALWETPLLSGPARRVADGPVTALATSPRAVLSASGSRLRRHRADSLGAATDSLELPGTITAAVWDSIGSVWYVAADTQLVRVREGATGLEANATWSLPAAARRIALSPRWIAVVMGDAGISAWDRVSLAQGGVQQPRRVSGEPRFAFDADFAGDTLYVAGGVDGLFTVTLDPSPRVLGSSRQFPFATLVQVSKDAIWVGDRAKQTIMRINR
jgi:hypothetical protein